jgi:hypothetical protein
MDAILTFTSINDKVSNHHLHQMNIGDECHVCLLASWTLHSWCRHTYDNLPKFLNKSLHTICVLKIMWHL